MREELVDSGNVYITDTDEDDPIYLFGECVWSGGDLTRYNYLVGFVDGGDSEGRRYCIPNNIEKLASAIESYEFEAENWGPISPSNNVGFVPPYTRESDSCIVCEALIDEPKDGVLMMGINPVHPSCSGELVEALDLVWDEYSGDMIVDWL